MVSWVAALFDRHSFQPPFTRSPMAEIEGGGEDQRNHADNAVSQPLRHRPTKADIQDSVEKRITSTRSSLRQLHIDQNK